MLAGMIKSFCDRLTDPPTSTHTRGSSFYATECSYSSFSLENELFWGCEALMELHRSDPLVLERRCCTLLAILLH